MTAAMLAWPGAVAIGVSLGLLGSGGSILTVPVLVYLFGQDEKVAIAGSLAIVGTIALVGSVPYIRRQQVDWRNVLLFGVPGMAGTYLGAWSATFVAGILQLALFAIVMLVAAWFMLKPIRLTNEPHAPRSHWKIVSDGLLVGIVTGLVGVGGGFLIVPALALLGGLAMHRAVATSLVIIALKSFSGFFKYVDVLDKQDLALDWNVLGVVTALGIGGSWLGNHIGTRLPQDKLKRVFGYFLIVMGIYILFRSLPGALEQLQGDYLG